MPYFLRAKTGLSSDFLSEMRKLVFNSFALYVLAGSKGKSKKSQKKVKKKSKKSQKEVKKKSKRSQKEVKKKSKRSQKKVKKKSKKSQKKVKKKSKKSQKKVKLFLILFFSRILQKKISE